MTTPPFHTVYSTFEVPLLEDAYLAVNAAGMMDWIASYTPEEGRGFMLGSHPNQHLINAHLKFAGHSGASYGWTMRVIQDIARRGWEEHRNHVRQIRAVSKLELWASTLRKRSSVG